MEEVRSLPLQRAWLLKTGKEVLTTHPGVNRSKSIRVRALHRSVIKHEELSVVKYLRKKVVPRHSVLFLWEKDFFLLD